MLKSHNLEPEKDPEENFFASNLPILMQAREMSPANLASLIRTNTIHLTDLMEGRREPSISQLIRLRRELGVPIDDLLLEDLTQVDSMDNLEMARRNEARQQAILAEIERMKEAQAQMQQQVSQQQEEIEKLKQNKGHEDGKTP